MKKLLFIISCVMFIHSAFSQNDIHGKYVAMPLPEWTAPVSVTGTEHYFVSYDITTGKETICDTNRYSGNKNSVYIEGYNPFSFEITEDIPGAKNFNDLVVIGDPTPFPWCTNVKLFMTFPNNSHFVGSGALINSKYVITAGHCVYSVDNGGWASQIEVVPAYYSGNKPYGSAYSANLYSWSGWTVSHNYEWDMGYIKLGQDIGNQTGWLGYAYNNDDNFFYTNTFNNPGYPAESPYDGSQMYYWYGTYDDVQTNLLYFNKYCYGGQSGSGSYYIDGSNNRYVYAVLSHSLGSQTGHVRITSDKFTSIYNQITGIGERSLNNKLDFSVSPNPCDASVCIKTGVDVYPVRIMNLLGQQVYSNSGYVEASSINMSSLPPGCYIVDVFLGNQHYYSKLVRSDQPGN